MRNLNMLAICCATLALGACNSAAQYVKKGDKKFAQGEYAYAIENYQQALEKGTNETGTVNYKIGESYRMSNRHFEATSYYETALENNVPQKDALYHYAFALKAQGKYTEAKDALKKFTRQGTDVQKISRAKKEIDNLEEIETLAAETPRYRVENFESLNTPQADYSPLYLQDKMVFTSARGEGQVYAATGGGFTDIYEYNLSADSAGAISAFDSRINVAGVHEAAATISPDGTMMVFARGNSGKRKGLQDVNLFISYYRNGEWSEPELLPISDPRAFDSTPAFSGDSKTLYFASTREGGFGGVDLYRAKMDRNGRWTRVRNMGNKINTRGNDMFPYVSDDNKLYFASDGHPSFGMLDLFVATREDGEITISNLGQPVNSPYDDFGLTLKNAKEGYFSSNREGGKGDDDIYYFEDIEKVIYNIDFVLEGQTKQRTKDGEQVMSGVMIELLQGDEKIAETTTGPDGSFRFELDPNANYTLIGAKEDYFTKRDSYATRGKAIPQEQLNGDTTLTLNYDVVLDKIVVDKAIVLDNIYYDLDKSDIRPDAARELDKLVQTLKDNPEITIELSSHTDDRGDDSYNQKLSQRRAESAVEYIVSQGIGESRLQAKGYGEDQPVVANAETEDQHQRNRRTEFKVVTYNK